MIIMKFGGTSVGRADRLERIIQIIKNTSAQERTIAVVSAMSGKTKAEGTTSRLLNALDFAEKGETEKMKVEIADVLTYHAGMINEIFNKEELKKSTLEAARQMLDETLRFLSAISEIREITAATRDRVIAVGEQLSAMIIASLCSQEGIQAVYADLGSVLQKKNNMTVDSQFFYELGNQAKDLIEKLTSGKAIAIASGYIGHIPGGIIENVGRGYTDYTSALLAASYRAKELQIWKEVDGIFSTDPRKVKSAVILPEISFDEAAEMAFFGTEAIHPKTMGPCVKFDIPIRVKNVDNLDAQGTLVTKKKTEISKGPKCITVKSNITVLTVNSNNMLDAPGFIARMGEIFRKNNVSIDLMATSEVSVSISVHDLSEHSLAILEKELATIGDVSLMKRLNSVSVIGHGMQTTAGIAGKVFSTMGGKGVNIILISQGASELSISFVIKEEDGLAALQALHDMMLEVKK